MYFIIFSNLSIKQVFKLDQARFINLFNICKAVKI